MSGLSLMIVPEGFGLTPPHINASDDDGDTRDDEGFVDGITAVGTTAPTISTTDEIGQELTQFGH